MNGCIKYLIVGLVVTGVVPSSQAANIDVTWGANYSTCVSLADGTTPVPLGNRVEVGTFTMGPTVGSPSLDNFVVFAEGAVGDGTGYAGSWEIESVYSESTIAHEQAYIVVFDNPAGVVGAGHQLGIYAMDMAYAANWMFPAGTDISSSTTIDLQDMVNDPGTPGATLKPGAEIIYGGGPVFETDGCTSFQLQTIPEPTSITLVGLGLLGALGFARRRP
ncbi:MAG TPA: PEP-CTERM sorting domain-containing protein [Verrucomicrobiae bacterium]|nr:PEP-CTERM sorting domain-containing protein [Verrucomicrobiae bacterium]